MQQKVRQTQLDFLKRPINNSFVANEKTKTHESSEDYLERILMLSKDGNKVRAIDIVNSMGYSKPSISIALHKLENEGMVYLDLHQHIYLTEAGREIAEKIYERHELMAKIFMSMGVDEEIAYRDSCRIEHVLSDETWEAIKAHFEQDK